MIRHLKIAYALETISFATGRRVEKELCRETGADMEKEKEEVMKEEGRENKEKEVLTRIRNATDRRHRSLLTRKQIGLCLRECLKSP